MKDWVPALLWRPRPTGVQVSYGVMLACVLHTSSDALFISMNGKINQMREEIFYINKSYPQRNQYFLHTDNEAGSRQGRGLLPGEPLLLPCLCFLLSTGHPVSMAAKVCLDAGSLLGSGWGLVGSSSRLIVSFLG